MTSSTRPTARALMVALLVVVVYGAGANIGSGAVLFLASGMLAGVGWSVVPFVARRRRLRATTVAHLQCPEGRARIPVTVDVPRGTVGTVGTTSTLSPGEESAVLRVTGDDETPCPDCDRPVHWAMLPALGGTTLVDVPAVVARGTGQRLDLHVHATDLLGLVRRVIVVPGPVVDVVPAHGVAAPFTASTHEDDAHEEVAHSLAASGAPGPELRQWRPGESIRAVHWVASMRTEQLLIRPRAPETHQRRTLGIEERAWTRTELDARCRDVVATAERLAASGVRVEISAGGRTMPWGPEAVLHLAGLHPRAGGS